MSTPHYETADGWDSDRQEADELTAQLESLGRSYGRRRRAMLARLARGDLAGAAAVCPHGSGYPLDSLAATNARDPRAGESGWRCCTCGSALDSDPFTRRTPVRVLHACEVAP